ncbi:MAG: hypothetical protein HYX60_06140 [Legionella longbeachae]|nr:hypothetical protein [Legionella longbeachae]
MPVPEETEKDTHQEDVDDLQIKFAAIDKANKYYDEQLERLNEARKKSQKIFDNLGESPSREKIESVGKSNDEVNKAAHNSYLCQVDIQNKITDLAEARYKQISRESTNQKEIEQAYQDYLETKKSADEAIDKAYDSYKATYNDNLQKYQSLTNPSSDISLSAPNKTETSPIKDLPSQPSTSQNTTIQSDSNDKISKKYQEKFKNDSWYKDNPPKKEENGNLNLSFKSEEDMAKFSQDLAQENESFIMVDSKTNKVIAYANGDGKLYHPDGEEFKKGDKFKPGEQSLEDFNMPSQEEPDKGSQNTI